MTQLMNYEDTQIQSICLPLRENGTAFVDIRFHTGQKCPSRCNIGDIVQKAGQANILALVQKILALVGPTTKAYGKGENIGVTSTRPAGLRTLGENMSESRTQQASAARQQNESSQVLEKTYNGISVYEMKIKDTLAMKRRKDAWMNASQILAIAGLSKEERLNKLATETWTLRHEKVQGGYAKYQGTWIPVDCARELCRRYNVEDLLGPLLKAGTNYNEDGEIHLGPTKAVRADASLHSSRSEQVTITHSAGPRDDSDLVNDTADPYHQRKQNMLPQAPSAGGFREFQFDNSYWEPTSEGIQLPVLVFDLVPTSGQTKLAGFSFGPAAFSGDETEAEVYDSLSSSTREGIIHLPASHRQDQLLNARMRVYIHIRGGTRTEVRENGSVSLLSFLPAQLDANEAVFFVQLEEEKGVKHKATY